MHAFTARQLALVEAQRARLIAIGYENVFASWLWDRINALLDYHPNEPEVQEALRALREIYRTVAPDRSDRFTAEELRVIDEEFERSQQRRAKREQAERDGKRDTV